MLCASKRFNTEEAQCKKGNFYAHGTSQPARDLPTIQYTHNYVLFREKMRNMGILDAVRESAEAKANSKMSEGLCVCAHLNFFRQSLLSF